MSLKSVKEQQMEGRLQHIKFCITGPGRIFGAFTVPSTIAIFEAFCL